jgi:hypothetical protein
MRFFRSAVVGMVLAIAVGLLAFALSPFFDAIGVYVMPAEMLAPVIGPLLASTVMYWLVPDGGVPASVLLIVISAFFFWTIVFGVAHFAWPSLRRPAGRSPVCRNSN